MNLSGLERFYFGFLYLMTGRELFGDPYVTATHRSSNRYIYKHYSTEHKLYREHNTYITNINYIGSTTLLPQF